MRKHKYDIELLGPGGTSFCKKTVGIFCFHLVSEETPEASSPVASFYFSARCHILLYGKTDLFALRRL